MSMKSGIVSLENENTELIKKERGNEYLIFFSKAESFYFFWSSKLFFEILFPKDNPSTQVEYFDLK